MLRYVRASSMLSLVALAACASAKTAQPAPTGPPRWTGTLRQPQMAASSVIGPATPARGAAYGSLVITPVEDDPKRFRVELLISAQVDPGTQLAWAIFTGTCGTPTAPIVGVHEFPSIEIGTGGGSVRTIMSLPLETRTSYYVNVYNNSRVSGVSNVLMCSNLALAESR
jgi:hypothetical protein